MGEDDEAAERLFDRSRYGLYPPGSTIKPFMALAALEYLAQQPEQRPARGEAALRHGRLRQPAQ